MKIIYFGGFIDNKSYKKFESNGINIDYSANNLQLKLFKSFINYDVEYINIPFVIINKIKKIPSFEYQINGSNLYSIPYLFIPYIKNIFKYYSIKKYLLSYSLEVYNIAIFYSLNSYFLKIAKLLKKINPDLKIIFIIPDMPLFMDTNKNSGIFYKILKKIDWIIIKRQLTVIDMSVTFTKQMYDDFFNKYINNNYVLNGIIDELNYDIKYYNDLKIKYNNKILIAYVGTVNEQYGIKNLINMANYLNDKYLILICGKGDMSTKLNKLNNSNIVYLGFLESEKAKAVLNVADVLINPRESTLDYDKYCFPSKLMEYISARKKIIVFHSKAMDEKYNSVFYYFNSNNPKDMADYLIKVVNDNDNTYKVMQTRFIEKYRSKNILNEILNQLY